MLQFPVRVKKRKQFLVMADFVDPAQLPSQAETVSIGAAVIGHQQFGSAGFGEQPVERLGVVSGSNGKNRQESGTDDLDILVTHSACPFFFSLGSGGI